MIKSTFDNKVWTLSQIFERQERFTFPSVQRGEVWKDEQKQLFIDTIITGFVIPPIFLQRYEKDNVAYWSVLDGQQRLSVIRDFLSNKLGWKASSVKDLNLLNKYFDGDTRGRVFFKDLPDNVQQNIRDRDIIIYIAPEDSKYLNQAETFHRLNNGADLKPFQKYFAPETRIRDLFTSYLWKKGGDVLHFLYSENTINNGFVDEYLVSTLKAYLWYVHRGPGEGVDLTPKKMFDVSEGIFYYGDNEEELVEYEQTLHWVADKILYFFDLIKDAMEDGIIPERKMTTQGGKAFTIFSLIPCLLVSDAYFCDEEFVDLFTKLMTKQIVVRDIVGKDKSAYYTPKNVETILWTLIADFFPEFAE